METYHKIQTLFRREQSGPNKGRMLRGQWTTPELEYLSKNEWEFTEKVDGTNIRIVFDPFIHPEDQVTFWGRTDKAQIPDPLLDALNNTFDNDRFYSAFDTVNPPRRVILFGEGYGPKIQSGKKYRDDHSFVLFDVKIGDFWLDRNNVDDVAAKLGIESVPTLGTGTLFDAIDIVSTGLTFEKSGAVKRWGRGTLHSQWGEFPAEGIVARPVVPFFDRKGQRIITKVKEVDFK